MTESCPHCGARSLYRDDDGAVRCLSCTRAQGPATDLLAPRQAWPREAQAAGEIVRRVEVLGESLGHVIPAVVRALTVEQAIALYAALERLGKVTWKMRCVVIGEIFDRLSGPTIEREEELAEMFGLARPTVANILAVRWAFDDDVLEQVDLPQRTFIAAARQPDPVAAVTRARDENLTAEEVRGHARRQPGFSRVSRETAEAPAHQTAFGRCASCGAVGPVELLEAPELVAAAAQ